MPRIELGTPVVITAPGVYCGRSGPLRAYMDGEVSVQVEPKIEVHVPADAVVPVECDARAVNLTFQATHNVSLAFCRHVLTLAWEEGSTRWIETMQATATRGKDLEVHHIRFLLDDGNAVVIGPAAVLFALRQIASDAVAVAEGTREAVKLLIVDGNDEVSWETADQLLQVALFGEVAHS